jgi:hypothetical protein
VINFGDAPITYTVPWERPAPETYDVMLERPDITGGLWLGISCGKQVGLRRGGFGKGAVARFITNRHLHSLVVPQADIDAGVEAVYNIQGASPHPHTIRVTAEHFAALRAGLSVLNIGTFGQEGHSHGVTLSCI